MNSVESILLGLTTPGPGRSEEFLRWYSEKHIPELLSLGVFSDAELYRFDVSLGEAHYGYAAIYTVSSEDPQTAKGELANGRSDGRVTPPPQGLYRENAQAWWGIRTLGSAREHR